MFSDDTAFMAHNHQDAQEIITHFWKSVQAFELKINHKKTEVIYQPPLGSHDTGQDIIRESGTNPSKQILISPQLSTTD